MQLGDTTGLPDTRRVGDVLVPEGLRRTDVDERRRQPRKVIGPRRRRVRGDVGAAAIGTQQRRPARRVGGLIPHAPPRHLPGGGRVVTVIEHRAQQHLPGQSRAATVPSEQRQRRGQPTARAATRDHDPSRVDAQLGGVRSRPQQPGVTVLHRRRMGMLGSKTVLHGDHDQAQLLRPVQRLRDTQPIVADDHSTAVHVVQRRVRRAGRRGSAHQQRHVGRPGRTGHRHVLDVERATTHKLLVRHGHPAHGLAKPRNHRRRHRRRQVSPEGLQRRRQLGVERRRRADGHTLRCGWRCPDGHGFSRSPRTLLYDNEKHPLHGRSR